MFLGQYQHNLDPKGRLTIPARFRDLLQNGAFITAGFEGNLMVMTVEAFDQIAARIHTMSITDPNARLLQRHFYSRGERVEVDKAGRILIPQFLRQAAHLDGEVMIVGVGKYFEIWAPEKWKEQAVALEDIAANPERFSTYDLAFT